MRDAAIGEMGQRSGRARRVALVGALLLLVALLARPGVAGAVATVKCTPNNAPVGTPINVAMGGLPAGQEVTLTTTVAGGAALTRATVTVAADGGLSVDLDTRADGPGDYTVQALDKAGVTLIQGRYSLTAAPRSLPTTGGGYATTAAADRTTLTATLALGTLALLGSAGLARRRTRRATGR
jgi:hypothetical protein